MLSKMRLSVDVDTSYVNMCGIFFSWWYFLREKRMFVKFGTVSNSPYEIENLLMLEALWLFFLGGGGGGGILK